MASVLLIDDDAELAGLLGAYLEVEEFAVTLAPDGPSALDLLRDHSFDIAVLDIMMPRMNGLEVLRRLRRDSDMPVLLLTARGDEIDRIAGLDLGADDYLAKPCSPGELAARLRAILRRTSPQGRPRGEHSYGPLSIDTERRIARWEGAPLALTGIEFNILEALTSRLGMAVSRADLSLEGLGRPLAPYDRALDVHISSIRQKLGTFADGRSPILSVRGIGYQYVLE